MQFSLHASIISKYKCIQAYSTIYMQCIYIILTKANVHYQQAYYKKIFLLIYV